MSTMLLRCLWLAGALLLGVLVGTAGGVLDWIGGDHPAKAIIFGAATFAATMTLFLLVANFVDPAVKRPGRRRHDR